MTLPVDDRVQKTSNFRGVIVGGEIDMDKLEIYLKDLDSDVQKIQQYVTRSGSLSAVVNDGFFVDRGDPSAFDFNVGDLTTDGTWNDLDLSSIVPAGALAVLIFTVVVDDTVAAKFKFRENGNSNVFNTPVIRTQVANIPNDLNCVVALDSDRVIEYNADNLTWTTISIVIRGWWI